jgi:8-oxo-dGTP pyrophosphatase MutT (NUDIX family)
MSSIRDAATIVLMRNGAGGVEALLVRRHSASGFMAGAFVFPGGKVDDADRAREVPASFVSGRLEPSPARTLSREEEFAIYAAACRETEEEAGIRVAAESLIYWAHWITPSAEPKRFDTRFFVCEVPPDQTPVIDLHEVTEARWMRPSDALAAHQRAEIFLPPPTQRTLEELAPFTSFAEVEEASATRAITAILPKVSVIEGAFAILLPWDPMYAATDGEGLAWSGTPSGASRILIRPRG